MNDEIPNELNRKIKLYSQALMLIGYFDADAAYDAGKAYADRKKRQGEVKLGYEGTGVEKEGKSEVEIYELRLKETEARAEFRKWSNLFKSTEHLIIALRREERTLIKELENS